MSYENTRAEAARWMYEREVRDDERPHFWRHTVFTTENRAPDTLAHKPKMAYQIFGDLVERGLLIPLPDDGRGPMYMINHGKDPEWREIMNHHAHFLKGIGYKLGDWIGGGLVGAAITAIIAWSLCS